MGDLALIAGSEAGLFVLRSRDDGRSWGGPKLVIPDLDVADVRSAPDGATYVGSRDRGLLRSRDGLQSWDEVEVPSALGKVRSLCITGNAFLAGSEARPEPVGVFEWQDGEQWRPLGNLAACSGSQEWWYPVAEMGVHVRHLAIDPHRPERLYAAIQVGGVAISPDGGESWFDRRNLDLDVHMIEGDPSQPGIVYAGTGGGGLYKSTDYGDTWNCISEGCGQFVVQFAMDPQAANRLYLGTGRGHVPSWSKDPAGARGEMWRSDDSGASWRKLGGGLPEYLKSRVGAVHVDSQEPRNVFFSGDNPRSAPDGGVYHSPDAGETWARIAAVPRVVTLSSVHL